MSRANFTLTVSTADDTAPPKAVWTSILASLKSVTCYTHWDDAGDGSAFLSDSKWYEAQADLATLTQIYSDLRFSVHVDETSGRQCYFDALDGETDVRLGDMDFPAITLWPTVTAVPPFAEGETPEERINALVDTIDHRVKPTGAQRGAAAVNALAGLNSHADDPATTIEDALSSLRHACRFLGLDFDALDRRAFGAFCHERAAEDAEARKDVPTTE
ncbi:hypothetical protein QCN27_20415 [Cereibacter sp. SYSU M97828]|nr:hypothetical protein [Cereibacter flavus]